jgi:hypothetical protein
MNDDEIRAMASEHARTMFGLLGDPKATQALTSQYYKNIERLAATMPAEKATGFRNRAFELTDAFLEIYQREFQALAEEAPAPTPSPTPYRPRGSSYVRRTATRAVVWNVVNSIFRVFR